MKIVLDTNILVGACKGSYHANRLLVACLEGKFTPLVGVALAEFDAKTRFTTRAKQGNPERGIELLIKP